jgi:pectate lyase
VLATHGAAITVANSQNIWVDHCDLSSDRGAEGAGGGHPYADLLDIGQGTDYSTISYNLFHDHVRASMVGGLTDNAKEEDTGKLHLTLANNRWLNIDSGTPSYAYGTGHIFK